MTGRPFTDDELERGAAMTDEECVAVDWFLELRAAQDSGMTFADALEMVNRRYPDERTTR